MDLEEKVVLLRIRIEKFRKEFSKELKEETDQDKAIFVFDKNDPHLLRKTENVRI